MLSNSLKRMNKKLDRQGSRRETGSYLEEDLWFSSPRPSSYLEDDEPAGGVTRLLQRTIAPMEARNAAQQKFINLLQEKSIHLLVASGPAGTGKTVLAVHAAARALCNGQVNKIVITRPAVAAGEDLGFLPGDMQSKMDPWLRPIYDALYRFWTPKEVAKLLENQVVEICPLAFMRGRTFTDSYIVCDEMQNTTKTQLMMVLTRIGSGSKMVVVGDPAQHDRLPGGQPSGFADFVHRHRCAMDVLGRPVDGMRVFTFRDADVVRHPIVRTVLSLYGEGPMVSESIETAAEEESTV